jgi:hypothetical protein
MKEDNPAPENTQKKPIDAKAARQERLAQNLRDNLRRRKAAARRINAGK